MKIGIDVDMLMWAQSRPRMVTQIQLYVPSHKSLARCTAICVWFTYPCWLHISLFTSSWVQEMACGRSEGVIFSRRQTNDIVKKKHARHRSYSNFHPPLKNVIFTVGVKSISKMSFLRSMGSTKKHASYGAWEANS